MNQIGAFEIMLRQTEPEADEAMPLYSGYRDCSHSGRFYRIRQSGRGCSRILSLLHSGA